MEQVLTYLPGVLEALGALVILATVIVRLTPSPKDDEQVASIAKKFFNVLAWLPTIGVNPRTKQLEAAYKELKDKVGQ